MLNEHHSAAGISFVAEFVLSVPFMFGIVIYLIMMVVSSHRCRIWPLYRVGFWLTGSFLSLATVTGPLAELSHTDFRIHMIGHLLLGMLGPLLMVLGAPVTLLLRSLPVRQARMLTKVLRSKAAGFLSHPILTAILNIGGLWVLYTTPLYGMMHESMTIHIIIHLHIFIAGYLFTVSMIYIDPVPHRRSYRLRSVILVLALAAHGILSKYIYNQPPAGVPLSEAECGAMIMYYGGDLVDLLIIIILCYYWFKATKPRENSKRELASI